LINLVNPVHNTVNKSLIKKDIHVFFKIINVVKINQQ